MLKRYPAIKWALIVVAGFFTAVVLFAFWFMSLIPSDDHKKELSRTHPGDLPYLSQATQITRGKVLAVVTSCETMGTSNKRTGYELTELARTYYVFQSNGFEVDIASPKGGNPPVVIDWDDMGAYDYAFLNDSVAQQKSKHTIPLEEIEREDYVAIFFAGGKGAMFDFPNNPTIQAIVKEYYQADKVIGAVCHGPAALVNVTLDDGSSILKDKVVSGFTNHEELFLIPNAQKIFPFLLEDALIAKGAHFIAGSLYLNNVCKDGNLVTGQNPWSTWALADEMIRQLGYIPVERTATAEENTISILSVYETEGYEEAKAKVRAMLTSHHQPIERNLLAIHSLIAIMHWDLKKSIHIVGLLSYAKTLSS